MSSLRKESQVSTCRTIEENSDSKCCSEEPGGVNLVTDFGLNFPHNIDSEIFSSPIHKVESSLSETSSLITNSSSEGGSVSTNSTRESIDDYSDYIFGESGCYDWSSPSNNSDDSDDLITSSSRESLFDSISYGYFSDLSSPAELESDLLNSDTTTKQNRRLTQQLGDSVRSSRSSSSSSSSREGGWHNPWKKTSRFFMRSG